jgi:hypothetical protein
MWTTRTLLTAACAALALGISAPAFAHGGSSGGGTSGGGTSGGGASGGGGTGTAGGGTSGRVGQQATPPPACPKGFVLKGAACVQANSGLLPDADLYRQGRALALAGYYGHALPILDAVRRTDDPMVYTMRGFVARKLGHYDTAMALYRHALALDPDNINTHEYIGESYVEQKRPDLARAELAKVAKLCGPGCEQYDDLAEAIETGRTE